MIIADMHLHLYPGYDVVPVLRCCVQHLSALAPGTVCVGCLAERNECHAYRSLVDSPASVSGGRGGGEVLEGGRSLVFHAGEGLVPLFLLPGRQIATRERLEILCIGVDAAIPDGEPAALTVRRVREVDGVPVLTWAVGKWLFKRRRHVMSLLDQFGPEQLLLGDSAMRPLFWPTPLPMRAGQRRGYRVTAGTDPLPAAYDAMWMGRYATLLDTPFDPRMPSVSFLRGVRNPEVRMCRRGRRCGPLAFVQRLRAHK